ncbi:general odorant-binding protein 28a-like [Bradysia coprophila]|uniref:general odorant-binding protein 28a-like n=1 Tax=Bradysia coprophila TaxID=38358 RepID=UPI00187DBA8D|nr:general odorant-binding protein 28a-like [Bradysia coprophila]
MSLSVKFLLLVCAIAVHAKPLSEEERQAMFIDIVTNCKAQEGASDSDIQEMANHQPPSTHAGQCLNACTMEAVGIMKDGRLSLEGSIKVGEMTGDAARIKNVELVSRECESTVGSDRCDTALQIALCVAKSAAAHGIDPTKELM